MIYTHDRIIPEIFPEEINAAFGTFTMHEAQIPDRAVMLKQVHGDRILTVEERKKYHAEEADGILTGTHNMPLVVRTADCVPILFYDSQTGYVGASHQGWKGTYERLPQKMIEKMREKGAFVENIRVAIGPSIGACCYRIFGERKEAFVKEFPNFRDVIFVKNNDIEMLSLLRLNYELLLEAGIKSAHIEYIVECTRCHESVFASFYRDKKVVSMYSFIEKSV